MKNLTTRKIVLGLLVGLVLALGVQGTADAIDTFTPGFAPVDLSNRDAGETIVVSNFATTVNLANVREYVSLSVSGGGANFPNPTDNTKTVTSYTWRETDTNTNDGTNHNDATLPSIGSQTITVNSPGEVTVTVSYTETYNTNQSRTTSVVSTYYVVKSGIDVNPNDAVSLLGVSNGVGAGYDHRKDIKIHSADSRYNQVTYTVNNGATLYIKEGNRDNKSGRAADANLITSSSADVWLSLVDNSSQVTAKLDRGGNTKNQALYIYGRPTLRVTAPSTNPPLLSGDPGQRRAVSDSPITIVIYDQTTGGAVDTTAVSGAPIKFDVADKSTTGGYLIPPPSVDSDTDLFSDNITDANGNLLRHSSLGSLLPSRTLYVRSSATVGFQFGTVPGTSEVTVSLSGTNVNLTEKITVRVTGGDIMTLSESSNRRRSSDSKLFDLVALVEEYGKPPALGTVGGNPGRVSVTFRASQGSLTSTPADETETSDASDTGTNLIANTGRFITEYVDANGRAQVIYNLGGNTGRQEIYASINDNNAETRKEIIFIVNGPAAPSGGGGGGGEPPSQTPRLTITSSTGTGTDRSVTVTATNAQGAVVPGLFVTLRGTALPDGSQDVRAGEATPITLPSTPDTYTLTATAPGYTSDTEGFTIEAPGTLAITAVGARSGTQQQITVTASGRTIPSGGVVVTLQGVTNPRTVTIQSGSTSVSRIATLPSASSPHTVTATAVGYNDAPPLTIPAPGQQPTTTTTTTTTTQTGTAGVADSIEIDGDRQRSGTVNQ
ncbi:MAG: hypothetical protein OXG97_14180, partial [Candidatus Poribacteria bacterium]|nr:hypothetical protein [Candidatus Poribacteria bacterium]